MTDKSSEKNNDLQTLYSQCRGVIEHEDNLVNNRLAWMLTFNAFLFTAYAVIYGAYLRFAAEKSGGQSQTHHSASEIILEATFVIATAGMFTTIAALAGTVAALGAIRSTAYHFYTLVQSEPTFPYWRIVGRRWQHVLGMSSAIALPCILLSTWTFLMLRGQEVNFPQSLAICALLPGFLWIGCSFVVLYPRLPDMSKFPAGRPPSKLNPRRARKNAL